jgi:4-amino-4-deoxy-L-arabinose transferase-like glycosyltransferase
MVIPIFIFMKLIKNNLIYLILVLAIILRFYNINNLPSLNPDEAALGYNAYSLLQTGKDEHGASWPLHFKSFGDYKPGGYVYLAMPFIKVFGLTPLAVRLPNLILSVATIFILYKLVILLTKSSVLALYSSSVLTINPWAIHFSRGAWESSTALFFLILGIYLFYKYINTHVTSYLLLFPVPLVASLYVYHSARLIVPVLFLILFIKYYKQLLNKNTILSLIFSGLLCIPLLFSFLNNGGITRFSGVGLTADIGPINRSEELLNQHGNAKLINRAMHNKRVLYLLSWSQKYLSHFDLNFLFINGDEVPRSKVPEMGQLYLIELPLIILGLFALLKHYRSNALTLLTLSFLFISPLASSLTFQAPSALRALFMVISLSILVAIGISKLSKPLILLLIPFYIFSLFYYLDAYYNHAPQRYPFAWNRGFSEIIPYLESQKNQYQNIYFTNKYDQPYILYLFFSQYNPRKIQSQIKLTPPDKFGFSTVEKIDNITFSIPEQIPSQSLVIDSSDYQLTQKSFKIYTTP